MPVTINGTTGITTPALVNGTALAFRNKIINGNFGINQRTYISGTATSGANQYTLDRWRVVTSGQNLTFSASSNGNIVTAPAGGIEQVIESLNIEGGTYTLSWTGTATGAVDGSAVSNGGQVILPANTNATIRFTSGTVSLVQLEEGSVATPFENRPIGTELALCQRYYQMFRQCSIIGHARSSSNFYGIVDLPVTMRATPTSTSTTALNAWYIATTTDANANSLSFSNNTRSQLNCSFNITSGVMTSGNGGHTRPTNISDTTVYFDASAEL
jgi:hypothetical protein